MEVGNGGRAGGTTRPPRLGEFRSMRNEKVLEFGVRPVVTRPRGQAGRARAGQGSKLGSNAKRRKRRRERSHFATRRRINRKSKKKEGQESPLSLRGESPCDGGIFERGYKDVRAAGDLVCPERKVRDVVAIQERVGERRPPLCARVSGHDPLTGCSRRALSLPRGLCGQSRHR